MLAKVLDEGETEKARVVKRKIMDDAEVSSKVVKSENGFEGSPDSIQFEYMTIFSWNC